MQYTSNYNLGLVEGTDLVNPMIQMNPNFSNLDTIIKGVSDSTITTATELTSGNIHSLTRTNTNANVFRWVATSNYNTGDTFLIDNVPVTALKTNGTTLQTGEYIIGASVLGILDGTRLTVYVTPKGSQTATDISYNNTGTSLTANNVQAAVNELDTNFLSSTTIYRNMINQYSTPNTVDVFGYVTKMNNLAFITFSCSVRSPGEAASSPRFILPEMYRPTNSQIGLGMFMAHNSNVWTSVPCSIDSNGRIFCSNPTIIDRLQGVFIYPVA